MKYLNIHILILIILILPKLALAQNNGVGNNLLRTKPCLSEIERAKIIYQVNENRKKLKLEKNCNLQRKIVDDLIFPLRFDSISGYNDFYGMSSYVDHDPTNQFQDYNCSNKSYDNHKGSDFFTFPFAWYLYDNNLAYVVNMFKGTIVLKQDGNADTNCIPNGVWNAVYVQHEDGSTMWYGHLKSGSLTSKSVGETIEKGEYLGIVASSGFSTGAHLHIEYYNENDELLDPFQGSCNNLNSESLWDEQPIYSNPKVNAVLTHSVQPNIECGPTEEISSFKNEFLPNDNLYVGVYLTNYIVGDIAVTNIYRPDNTLFDSFNTFNNQNSFEWYWNSREYLLKDSEPFGTWKVECTLNNKSFAHTFEFNDQSTAVEYLNEDVIQISPNPSKNFILLTGKNVQNCSKFKIYNLIGQEVKQGKFNAKIDISNLAIGTYVLMTMSENGVIQLHKFIKY